MRTFSTHLQQHLRRDRRTSRVETLVIGNFEGGGELESDCIFISEPVPRMTFNRLLEAARVVVIPLPADVTMAGQLTLIHSFHFGKAVIASDVPCMSEYIQDGIDGLLVPPEDPEALAAALVRVLEDDRLARRLAEAGRRRFLDLYSMELNVRRLEAVYEEAVADGGTG